MTKFAMALNEKVPEGMEKKLAPTDCRLRPDQHALEEGVYDQVKALALGNCLECKPSTHLNPSLEACF